MNENKVSLINMAVTASIGFIIFALIFGQEEPMKILVLILFYPVSYFITRFYIKTGVKNPFLGFLEGGIFSVIGTAIVLGISSTFGKFNFFDPSEADGFIAIVWGITAIIAFIIGGIAGIVISLRMQKNTKKKK